LQTVYRQCIADRDEIATILPAPPYFANVTSSTHSINSTVDAISIPSHVPTVKSDLSTAVHNHSYDACTKPESYVPETTLAGLWHVVYWTCQALTWWVQWHNNFEISLS